MSIAINKILVSLSIILVLTLFIGIRATDVDHADHALQSNENSHYMDKQQFLPNQRELDPYIKADISDNNKEEDKSHLNAKRYFLKSKRYFLKSKRYFLKSKRDNERIKAE